MTDLDEFMSVEIKSFDGKRLRWIVQNCGGYETDCWLWFGRTMPNGYPMLTKFGRSEYAHRHYYKLFTGKLIPVGLDLDHLCRVRNCVNPTHVEPVTRLVNAQRGAGTKLTLEKVARMRVLSAQGVPIRKIGRELGVTGPHVCRVLQGKYESWI